MGLHVRYLDHPRCPTCNGEGQIRRVDGTAIRRRRQESDISLRAMALKLEISPAYLSDMELGKRQMSEKTAEEIVGICEHANGRSR